MNGQFAGEKQELFDLYDANRRPLHQTMVRGSTPPQGAFRLVVHVCFFKDDKMLCQRRQPFKKSWSNMWDISVGGSVVSGETSLAGATREVKEELGLDLPQDILPSFTICFQGGFDDYYCVNTDIDESACVLQTEEVAEVKWLGCDEILSMIDLGMFIPYNKSIIELLFFLKDHRTSHTHGDPTKVKNHPMNLDDEYFRKISDGSKTIELRLDDERRQILSVGDYITFTNNTSGKKLVAKILALHKFPSFFELYKTLDLTKCGYSKNQLKTAHPSDMEKYYDKDKIARYGVLGIEIVKVAEY